MGFRPKPTTYRLTFKDDEDLDGLVVEIGSVKVSEWTEMLRISADATDMVTNDTITGMDRVLELFSSKLVSWNLEDEKGSPVPTTLEGVLSQERPLIRKLTAAWQMAMIGVNPDLGKESSSGGSSEEEETLGLGELSASPTS